MVTTPRGLAVVSAKAALSLLVFLVLLAWLGGGGCTTHIQLVTGESCSLLGISRDPTIE